MKKCLIKSLWSQKQSAFDTGLFVAMLEEGSAGRILSGELGMYKGAIYENTVADAFSKSGRSLFYFHKESGLEIDFITPLDAEVTLVEVKATNGNAKSANIFKDAKVLKYITPFGYTEGSVLINDKALLRGRKHDSIILWGTVFGGTSAYRYLCYNLAQPF